MCSNSALYAKLLMAKSRINAQMMQGQGLKALRKTKYVDMSSAQQVRMHLQHNVT